jgi:RNase adaptor protein for sRNA GlmZ degradation
MKKKNAMQKCIPLWGNYIIKNEQLITRYEDRKKVHTNQHNEKIGKILNKAHEDNIDLQKVASMIKREEDSYDKKIKKIDEKIQKWKEKDPQYSFVFKSLS